MSVEPSRILAQQASLSPRAFYGLVGIQSTILGKWFHAYSGIKGAVLYSANSPWVYRA